MSSPPRWRDDGRDYDERARCEGTGSSPSWGTMSASAGPAPRVDADPEEVGLDPERLARLERHFTRYLDDGRLPGWLIAIVRHGRLAYLRTAGRRDLEADLPVEPDTLWRI